MYVSAQAIENNSGDSSTDDSAQLFEQGQNAHARGQLNVAIQLYERAIRVQPEFPEAEYQRAAALLSLNRAPEAERGFRRAITLRPDWALPHAALGDLLARDPSRDAETRTVLQHALQLDASNTSATIALASVLMRGGDARGALDLLRRATMGESVDASTWMMRAAAERALGDLAAASTSLDRAITLNPNDASTRLERAELHLAVGATRDALQDLRIAENIWMREANKNFNLTVRLASLYARAGDTVAALRTLDALDERERASTEVVALRSEITGESTPESRAALEQTLARSSAPSAALLARLGAAYRTSDPQRSLEFYRRAVEIEPRNADYATGYAAALVQARRFEEAIVVLRRIITVAPENYAAHTNLAAALDALGRHAEALVEYQWINRTRPDLAITHYFIARTHDLLGQLPEALAAYETFLARADAQQNSLEIDRVNLRLPNLRNQIRRQGRR